MNDITEVYVIQTSARVALTEWGSFSYVAYGLCQTKIWNE